MATIFKILVFIPFIIIGNCIDHEVYLPDVYFGAQGGEQIITPDVSILGFSVKINGWNDAFAVHKDDNRLIELEYDWIKIQTGDFSEWRIHITALPNDTGKDRSFRIRATDGLVPCFFSIHQSAD